MEFVDGNNESFVPSSENENILVSLRLSRLIDRFLFFI